MKLHCPKCGKELREVYVKEYVEGYNECIYVYSSCEGVWNFSEVKYMDYGTHRVVSMFCNYCDAELPKEICDKIYLED